MPALYCLTDGMYFRPLAFDYPEDSRAVIRKHALPWEQILGTGNVAMDAYGINGIPQVILFGPDGTILKRDLYGELIDKAVKEALGL